MMHHILLGGIIFLSGLILRIFPPKNRNWFYGYRSRKSMRSQDSWVSANQYAANLFIYFGLASIVLGFVTYYTGFSYLVPVVAGLCALIVSIIMTEQYLNKKFPG